MNPESTNIASHLPAMAQRQPEALAVVVQEKRGRDGRYRYRELTAKELDEESNRLARGLEKIGIGRGVRTALMVKPSIEFFTLAFALFKAGAIPVMVDPGMGVKNLGICLAEAEPEAFIGIAKAQAARVLFRWGRSSIKTTVTVGRRFFWGGHTLAGIRQPQAAYDVVQTQAGDMAAILFTSGSTGIPKGAVYTHGVFNAQVECLRDDYHIKPGELDLATFPLFALFGPALGMTAVVPYMDASRPITADPRNLVAAMKDYKTTNLSASPALVEVLGRYGAETGVKLPLLKRVISAGAPAREDSLQRLSSMLSTDAQILPSYGATEAMPICSIDSKELVRDSAEGTNETTNEGAGICVGRPMGGVTVKIIEIRDSAIPEWSNDLELPAGEIGEICVQGPVVTHAYYNRPEATALAKIEDIFYGAPFHRMGDVGYLDEEGRLWFCGRKAHRVVTSNATLFTIPCERVFNAHPNVYRTALVGVARDGDVIPVLCVELNEEDHDVDRAQVKKELLEMARNRPQTQKISHLLFHPSFPVDVRHNAKIFREELAEWTKERLP